jgi:hypothetical protein
MSLLAAGYTILIAPQLSASVIAVAFSAGAIGVGMGMANLTTLVAAQSSVAPQRIGVATSTVMLFRTFGAAFAVSVMGTVMLVKRKNSSPIARLNPLSTQRKNSQPQNLLEPLTRARFQGFTNAVV